MVYAINIAYSVLLMTWAGRISDKVLRKTLVVVAAILPIVLLSVRGNTVGTDTYGYINSFIGDRSSPISYGVFSYWISQCSFYFFENGRFGLFVFALITVLSAFGAISYSRNIINPALHTLFYMTFIYPLAFNIVRQATAISIVIWLAAFFSKKEYRKSVFVALIAFLFHPSASVVLMLFLLLFPAQRKTWVRVLILVLIVAMQFFMEPLLRYSLSFGIFSRFAMNYNILSVTSNEIFKYFISAVTRFLPIVIVVIIITKRNITKKKHDGTFEIDKNEFVVLCASLMYASSITYSLYSTYLVRIGFYFGPFVIYLINGFLMQRNVYMLRIKLLGKNFNVLSPVFAVYFVVYFWYVFYYLKYDALFPYVLMG